MSSAECHLDSYSTLEPITNVPGNQRPMLYET